MLMAAMVLSLSLSFTACSDDDGDKSEQQKKEDVNKLDTDDARVAFRWLCVLADVTTLDDNWQSKTYEPTVGVRSDNNEFTRLIIVSDLDEAKEHFSKLADLNVNQLGVAQTVNGGAAGTMKWTPSKEAAKNLAEVEVSSRIMPHLQKLVYCTEEQTGQNGLLWDSMKGVAYYRLGDVVRDGEGYYWVCVRPSFAPDKGDSHWINIYNAGESGKVNGEKKPIKSENVCADYNQKDKYDGKTIKLPTQLSYDREHIYNLNNLLWALLKPEDYRTTTEVVGNKGKGLCGFDYGYHGVHYLANVAKFWDIRINGRGTSIWEILFGKTHEEMSKLHKLNFFYYGYKWWWGSTADMWIYQSTAYLNKYGETGSMSDDKYDIDVVSSGFDINRYAGDPAADQNASFAQLLTDDDGNKECHWVVRYKRGDKLSTTKYDPYNRLGGCEDIYRYNQKTGDKVGKDEKQVTDDKVSATEEGYFFTGSVIEDETGTRWYCYAGWQDGEVLTVDRKARFFSFQNFQTAEEKLINGYDSDDVHTKGLFATGDLMPEKEAPLFGYFLDFIYNMAPNVSAANPVEQAYVDNFNEMGGLRANELMVTRDTIYVYPDNNAQSEAKIRCVNIAIIPDDGRDTGSQPYMRYIIDGTRVGANRGGHDGYPINHFNTCYTDFGASLDLVHLYKYCKFMTDRQLTAIHYDKWSHCKRRGTNERDGDFRTTSRHTARYLYTDYKEDPGDFTSAYYEPVVFARYLELDDPGIAFRETYGGHKYKLIYQPNQNARDQAMKGKFCNGLLWAVNHAGKEPMTYKDGEPYNISYIKEFRE